MTRRLPVVTVYLAYMALDGFLFRVMSVIFSVFLILRLGLGPFQLVVMGTILEGSYLLFETPTGIVADTISRRTSVIIGLAGGGVGFLILGLLAQLLDGGRLAGRLGRLRHVPERSRCGMAHRRGRRGSRAIAVHPRQPVRATRLWFAGIIVGVALGTMNLALPIVVSGVGLLFLAIGLWIVMPEDNFQKRARGGRRTAASIPHRDVQGGDARGPRTPRPDAHPGDRRPARSVDRGVRSSRRSPPPARHRTAVDREPVAAVVVRDPGWRSAADRVRMRSPSCAGV